MHIFYLKYLVERPSYGFFWALSYSAAVWSVADDQGMLCVVLIQIITVVDVCILINSIIFFFFYYVV